MPVVAWLSIFLLVPLAWVIAHSLASKGMYGAIQFDWNFANFSRAADLIYLKILWNSVKLALLTALSCLVLGLPVAYTMARSRWRARGFLMVAVVIPFWTNLVVRTYALKLLLSEASPINSLLLRLGWISAPFALTNSQWAVWIGMVVNYLPFMILPLFVSLEKFDFTLLDAARDLGASSWNSFFRVLLPLIKPGVASGLALVFTPALGEFVIPDLLGGARVMLLGNLITDQFLKARDWPFGAAISVLLIGVVVASLLAVSRQSASRIALKASR